MNKTIGQAGLNLIKKWEGCRLTAYKDAVGVWTIGYGHTNGVYAGQTITQDTAERLLVEDCQIYANYVDSRNYCPVTGELNANQRDALISFTYNCGAGSLQQLCKGRTIKQIAEHITAYNRAGGKVLQGLVNRRNDELNLFNTPVEETEGEEMVKRYNTIEEVPEWGKSTVCKLITNGIIAGTAGGLDLSLDMLRILVWNDRMGLYGKE